MTTKREHNTYISLFSSAGVGCYGFKQEGFDCVATCELIPRRIEVQKYNDKCKYQSGYICGDICEKETKDKIFKEIKKWKENDHINDVDVVIATPPCQGMSVANHNKSNSEIVRNSLVVESIKVILEVSPKFFIFENVASFMKTECTDIDGQDKPIAESISQNLGKSYVYISKVINFKNYGACSSRQRTLVIGVRNDMSDEISPIELFPDYHKEKTLKDTIGDMKSLSHMGEIDDNDIYHFFRKYPEHMRPWIHGLDEGHSAFENTDPEKIPHRIIDGKIVFNVNKNGDKYRRNQWNKVGPCIHTRNDQLASQNTIHPSDDRVFSVREIMKMMTVPDSFKWSEYSTKELNRIATEDKVDYLKKHEINIRQSLGEAVPTCIFKKIAHNINTCLSYRHLTSTLLSKILLSIPLNSVNEICRFINENKYNLSPAGLSRVAELCNNKRTENAAYFTSKPHITRILGMLPSFSKNNLKILEPSVGVGNFLPLVIKFFDDKSINLDVVDVDSDSLKICKQVLKKYKKNTNVKINYLHDDFLLHKFNKQYDITIGNPPFGKIRSKHKNYNIYKHNAINKNTNNICSYFLDKSTQISNYVALVLPKNILNGPEFEITRQHLSRKRIDAIIDFGEKGFPGVLIETVSLLINNEAAPCNTSVFSVSRNKSVLQKQKYICDDRFPYWLIYRNHDFDKICNKMDFGVFDVFRDRQITKNVLSTDGNIRVLKSRNILSDGSGIVDIAGYDAYINEDIASGLSVFRYKDMDNVYLAPNMTYNPRVIKKPKGVLVNGSIAIIKPKNNVRVTDRHLKYLSSTEYKMFYRIARNFQTRSLNIDSGSIYFYGLVR